MDKPVGDTPQDDLWIDHIIDENLRLQNLVSTLMKNLNRDEDKIPVIKRDDKSINVTGRAV